MTVIVAIIGVHLVTSLLTATSPELSNVRVLLTFSEVVVLTALLHFPSSQCGPRIRNCAAINLKRR